MLDETTNVSRSELLLRARISELEARLTDTTRCLVAAESRAADLLSVSTRAELAESVAADLPAALARADAAERWLAQVTGSVSWRLTSPARAAVNRLRDLSGP